MSDIIKCRHCGEETHIGGLIGEQTNDCPKCGKQALFADIRGETDDYCLGDERYYTNE